MKLALLKGRRQKQVTLPCSLAAWPVRLGDTIRVSLPRRGWTAKTFEVTGRTVHIGEDGVRVTLSCIETGPAIFDWRTSEEMPKPAGGVPTLPSPTAKPVVSAPTMTEELYETRGGGGVKTRVRLSAKPALGLGDEVAIGGQRLVQRIGRSVPADHGARVRALLRGARGHVVHGICLNT
ncbi:hypothetical protein JMM61_21170, partial [Rhodovulum sulfidophilum]|nr:hypothetical protein [Rhodovulum sulfidophilum]